MQTIKTNDKPNTPPGPVPAAAISLPRSGEAIPVKILKFKQPNDVPGDDATSGIRAGGPMNQRRWEITYLPGMHHHMIVYYVPDPKTPPVVAYVPEGNVSMWIPA